MPLKVSCIGLQNDKLAYFGELFVAGETQACVDAAAEHRRILEDQAIAERTEHAAARAEADRVLEMTKRDASQVLQEARSLHQAETDRLSQQLADAQVTNAL